MVTGKVKFYNNQKGFSLIPPDDGKQHEYVHATALEKAGIWKSADQPFVFFGVEVGEHEFITLGYLVQPTEIAPDLDFIEYESVMLSNVHDAENKKIDAVELKGAAEYEGELEKFKAVASRTHASAEALIAKLDEVATRVDKNRAAAANPLEAL